MGESENRWEGKPFRAFVIRAFAFLAPVAAALFVAWWLSNVIPRPSGWGLFALWWLSILVISTVVLRVTERFARKLLPLAALLKLTLVFPDRAPDRFTMSMRTGGAETLEEMAEQAQAASDQDDFATAAETILALAARLNSHDPRTRGHAERVRAYADMIAEEMGFDDEDRNKVKWACMLHDIGKLKVPLEIINKPGRLTDEEYEVIKNHPTWGMELAEPLLPWLGDFASGIGQHHERFDGFGYPNGISGVEIGLAGRIAAVADTFDVITSVRSYKQARPASEAREELARCAGSQFDPEVVRAFLNIGLGRQRWVAGPLSWLGQIPMVQSAVQGFTTLATNAGAVASTAATATALGAAAIVAPNMFPAAPAPVELPATAIVVAADDFGRVDENGVITLDSLGNDQGDIASSRVVVDPVNGTAQILNNQIVYTPNPGFSGIDSVEYEICNDQGECDTAIVTITVEAANQAPVQIGSTALGVEDETLLIDPTTLVSDPEGSLDRSSLRVIGAPGSGVASVTAAGDIRYVPGPDFNGTDTITYEICDTDGLCLTETVIVTIEPANDLPEVTVSPVSGSEDSPVFIGVDAVDPDGDPVSTFIDSAPANGSVEVGIDGNIIYTPDPDFFGVDSFDISVCDPSGGCETLTISVPITGVNDSPVVPDRSFTTDEDTLLVFDPIAGITDPDGDTITMTGFDATSTAGGTITQGSLRYQPPTNYVGPDSFTYTISDGTVSINVPVLVTVADVNDLPTGAPASLNPIEDQIVVFDLLGAFTDADGDPITVTGVTISPANAGTLTFVGGILTVDPVDDFVGTITVSYTVSDGIASIPSTLQLNYTSVNDLPVLVDDVSGVAGTAVSVDVLANDSDVEGLDVSTLAIVTPPSSGTAVVSGAEIIYTPPIAFSGTTSLVYQVCDTDGACDTATLTIDVNAPVGVDDAFDVPEDSAGTPLDVIANDLDADSNLDSSSLVVVAPAGNGTTALASGKIVYKPAADHDTTDSFSYQVCDAEGSCTTATVSITMNPLNDDAPLAADDAASFTEVEPGYSGPGVVFNVLTNDTDPDSGDTLTVSAIDLPGNGALIDLGSGGYEYVPDANFFGTESLSYTVEDAATASDSAVVTITVANTPDAPQAQDDAYSSSVLGALVIEAAPGVLSNDTDYDSDPLTVVSMTQRVGDTGILAWNADGSFTYSPPALFIGKVFLDYTVSDSALTDDGVVTITIDPGIVAAGSYFGPAPFADGFGFQPTPPDGTVTDPDFDSNPGLTIAEGGLDIDETDPTQYVRWYAVAGPTGTEYNGPISLQLWSSHVGFDASGGSGHIAVHLRDCAPDGTACGPSLLSYDQHIGDWNGGVADFVYREIALGDLSYTLPAGRVLQAQVMFAHASMWVATHAPYNSQLVITEANLPPEDPEGSDAFVVDEDSTTAAAANTFDVLADDTDIDLDPSSLTINVAPINGTAVVNGSNEIEYTPNPNFYSDGATDDFKYRICDATPACTIVDVFVTVSPVNDVPVFILPVAPVSVLEDDGGVTINNFATPASGNIFEGALNELAQDHTFIVAAVDPTAFANQPVINADGRLQFTLEDDVHGTYDVDVYLIDDGGTPGIDTSPTQTFSIVAAPVNDEPSWVDTDVSVAEFTGSGTFEHVIVGYTTPVTGPTGPNVDESGQTATFTLTDNTDNPALFAVAPTIDASGTLRFTMAAQAFGQADVGFTMSDDGGTLNAGVNTGSEQTFQIEVVENDEPPVISTNNALALNVGQTALISNSDLESTDPDNPPAELDYNLTTPLTLGQFLNGGAPVTSFTQAEINGGLISYQSTGGAGTESVGFEVDDGTATASGTFTININNPKVVISQVGDSADGEFIELYNIGPGPVVMSGWQLKYDNIDEALPSVVIPEGGRYLIVRPGWSGIAPDHTISGTGPSLAGSDMDLKLQKAAPANVDRVAFGSATGEGTSLPQLAANSSYERKLSGVLGNCQDTNDNEADFWRLAPNPRNSGSVPVSCHAASAPAAGSNIVISEFSSGAAPIDGADFFELKNTGTVATDIDGWVFNLDMALGGLGRFVYTGGPTVLAPGQHFLFVRNTHPGPIAGDAIFSAGTAFGVELLGVSVEALGAEIDAFGLADWGYTSAYAEGAPIVATGSNYFYQRNLAECADTDSNVADFSQIGSPDPDNSAVIEPC